MTDVARLVSCNVSLPVMLEAGGRPVPTGIFKKPAAGRVKVGRLNLEGDRQADLTVHGGVYKAVYAYPSEHYAWWHEQLPGLEMPWGMFGENLTTEGITENVLPIGARLEIGTVVLQVTQPRMPCFKLAAKFGREDMVKRFWASERCGFYLSVVTEGELAAGDAIRCDTPASGPGITVAEVLRLYRDPSPARETLERALASPLAPSWKEELRERLATL